MSGIEAMTWHSDAPMMNTYGRKKYKTAEDIVEWVSANGGEARYDNGQWVDYRSSVDDQPPRIVITGPQDPIIAHPGDTIRRVVVGYRVHNDSGLDLPVIAFAIDPMTAKP